MATMCMCNATTTTLTSKTATLQLKPIELPYSLICLIPLVAFLFGLLLTLPYNILPVLLIIEQQAKLCYAYAYDYAYAYAYDYDYDYAYDYDLCFCNAFIIIYLTKVIHLCIFCNTFNKFR